MKDLFCNLEATVILKKKSEKCPKPSGSTRALLCAATELLSFFKDPGCDLEALHTLWLTLLNVELVQACAYAYICIYVYAHVYIYIYICVCVCVCVCAYIYMCIHTYT